MTEDEPRPTSEGSDGLVEALEEAAVWHDAQAKALSKQPQSGDIGWRRMEHKEQADLLRTALSTASPARPVEPADSTEREAGLLKRALQAILDKRALNAGGFKREGLAWKAYDDAILDCYETIHALAGGKEPGQ